MKDIMFREIAFEAELDHRLHPECEHQAFIRCREVPSDRNRAIEELRNMIYEKGECHPPRVDDAFLLRFLRVRRSVPARAHRLLVRYCKFREQYPHLWKDVYWYDLSKLKNIYEGVLYDRPDVGRVIIFRLGVWDPDEFPVEDVIAGCMLLQEIGVMQPKIQILGGTAIVDCEGIGFKHVRQLSSSVAMQAMSILGLAFPIHMRELHVINCRRMFEKLAYVMAPSNDLWNRVHFHGYDHKSLHQYVDPECLPERYGGKRQSVSLQEWLTKIKKYKNKEFDNDMAALGYAV